MFSFQLFSALSSAALLVVALPPGPLPRPGACDPSGAVMDLPSGQTQLVVPTTAPFSTGAVASLFDLSCIDKSPAFASIQTTVFNAWNAAPAGASANTVGGRVGTPTLLGFHYFVTSPSGTGISPKWDFTSTGKFAGNSSAFVTGSKVGDITAPTDSATNVDWLAINNVEGSLASKVFRIDTVNGQPPTSCVAGSADISVKYTAKYFLY
ncbi:hypothetical protein B0H14DRAFT_3443021 [Mycena olivaceomarginata]|nr:hypothetical protein B0H14DRAFT_3443021 [Mycena olivaceomarginata]